MIVKKEVYITEAGSSWFTQEQAETEDRIERLTAFVLNKLELNTETMNSREIAEELLAKRAQLIEILS